MAQELTNGTVINGNYRMERVLGQGGFGITYMAFDIQLEDHVAIKEFFPKDYCDRDAVSSKIQASSQGAREIFARYKAKFLKEARSIFKLNHPGIIKVQHAGQPRLQHRLPPRDVVQHSL